MTDTTTPGTPTPTTPTPRNKRSLGRLILRLFGVLVLLVIVGLAALYYMRNTLIRTGVIRGGTYATDQTTALEAADLSFAAETLGLRQLMIANPSAGNYKEPQFLTMKDCAVKVQTNSLLSNTVVVDNIHISGLEIYLEQNGAKNNLAEIMNIIKKKSPAASTAPAGSSAVPQSPGKSLKINHITLASTKVHLRGIISLDIDLGPIQLDDPTNPDGRPMKIADVIAKVLLHVAQQIVNNPQLPTDFKNGLKDVSKLVDNMKGELEKGMKDATKSLQDATKGLQDAGVNLPNIGQEATKGLQDMGKGFQNLIPGQKPATKP